MVVALATTNVEAATPPIVTEVAPVKFVPVMVTDVPPAVLPEAGVMDVTVGGGATNVKRPAPVNVLSVVVTLTSTAPLAWAGVVAVIDVGVTTVKAAAGVPPNDTPETPEKPPPPIVTTVPPEVEPLDGVTDVT
jgi:hypothetical protein